jgi:hypothetical protein
MKANLKRGQQHPFTASPQSELLESKEDAQVASFYATAGAGRPSERISNCGFRIADLKSAASEVK